MKIKWLLLPTIGALVFIACCSRPAPAGSPGWDIPGSTALPVSATIAPGQNIAPVVYQPYNRQPGEPVLTPTPDPIRTLPAPRTTPEQHTVQSGDTLGQIAQQYNVSIDNLVSANKMTDPNRLDIGQVLEIPAPTPGAPAPSFKIIPDSELVYGPMSTNFDIEAFVQTKGGYLAKYQEEVDLENQTMTGVQIVERIAQNYSVNPRLLLAVLEYQSHWVTNPASDSDALTYPIRYADKNRKGLYRQLAFAADNLNRGFYLWRVNGLGVYVLADGSLVPLDPSINAGTAGVQHFFSKLYDQDTWRKAVTENGLFATYHQLFGYPFDFGVEPLLPANLTQPMLQLPFEEGKTWSFTGGPHGGWGDGSGWAGLDFAPPGDALGCVPSDEWVTAMADGIILRTGNGAVIQDLDGDQQEQTGWLLFYMHVESRDRIQPGAIVHAGDHIGHPSCEGGVSNGTHVHIARRYNGEWIPADGTLPFILDGWVSSGDGIVYDGRLQKSGQIVKAWEGRIPENQISR